jgi:hypothetical protein
MADSLVLRDSRSVTGFNVLFGTRLSRDLLGCLRALPRVGEFVQDGTSPFYGFVLADRLSGVDSHATFVLTRVTGEDDVDAVVARLSLLRALSRSHMHVYRMRLMCAPTPEGSSAGYTKMGWVPGGDVTPFVQGSWRQVGSFYGQRAAQGRRRLVQLQQQR